MVNVWDFSQNNIQKLKISFISNVTLQGIFVSDMHNDTLVYGKDITVEELLKIKEEVTAYLEQILNNINQYITRQDYLDRSQINDR